MRSAGASRGSKSNGRRRPAARRGVSVRTKPLTRDDKAAINAACERFISDRLRPHFLPEVRVTQFNYPIDIRGRWRASSFTFLLRYRSGFPENAGEEFDAPFARLDHADTKITELRFDVFWRRHNERWWLFARAVPLDAALRLIETEPLLQPHT